jgi:hypothetical protein
MPFAGRPLEIGAIIAAGSPTGHRFVEPDARALIEGARAPVANKPVANKPVAN